MSFTISKFLNKINEYKVFLAKSITMHSAPIENNSNSYWWCERITMKLFQSSGVQILSKLFVRVNSTCELLWYFETKKEHKKTFKLHALCHALISHPL